MIRSLKLFILVVGIVCVLGEIANIQKQECTCKEGEKNCPCLAQKQDVKQPREREAKVGIKVKAKVPVDHLNKKQLLKYLSMKVKVKKLAPKERNLLVKLKLEFKSAKAKMKALKGKMMKAPAAQRKKYKEEKKTFKNKCVDLKRKIEALKETLAKMEMKFKEECLKRAQIKEAKAINVIKDCAPKIASIKVKIKEVKEMLKVAPKADIPAIKKKIMKLKVEKKKHSATCKKAKTFVQKLQKAKKLGEEKKKLKIQKKLKKDLVKKTKKYQKLKAEKKKLIQKLSTHSWKLSIARKALKGLKGTAKKAKIAEIKALTLKIKKMKAKVSAITKAQTKLKKEIKEKAAIHEKVGKDISAVKESDRCVEMQKKLTIELKLMKKLKNRFDTHCKKAITTQKKKHVAKVLAIKSQINKVKVKIEAIKKALRKAPQKERRVLAKKIKEMEKQLQKKAVALKKSEGKLKSLEKQELKHEGGKKGLKAKKLKLIAKIARRKKQIVNYKKEAELLKLQHKKACDQVLQKEKKKSSEAIIEIKHKLIMGKKYADLLKKMLVNTKELAELTEKADKFKLNALQIKDKVSRSQVVKQEKELRAKIAHKKQLLEEYKNQATLIRNELEQRTKEAILNDIKLNHKAVKEVQKLIKEAMAKQESIQNELKTAKVQTVIEALNAELFTIRATIKELNIKIMEYQEEEVSLEHELKLYKVSVIQRQREEELQQAIIETQMKEREVLAKKEWDVQSKKTKETKVSYEKKEFEKILAEYNKKLELTKAEYTTYKVALQAGNKKKLLDVLDSIRRDSEKKIAQLKKKLKAEKSKFEAMKIQLEKTHSEKIKALNAKLEGESKAKQMAIKKLIAKETSRGLAAIKAAQLKSKMKIAKEKGITKEKIIKLQKEIKKLKKQELKKQFKLDEEILKAKTKGNELKTLLELKKKQRKQKEKEMVQWQAAETKSFTTKVKKIKDSETKSLAKIKKDIEAEKAKNKKEEAELLAKLKTAKAEIVSSKAALKKEAKNYKKLQVEMNTYVTTQTTKNKQELKTVVAKNKVTQEEMKVKIAKVKKSIETEENTLKKLKKKLQDILGKIKGLKKREEQRATARDLLENYEILLISVKAKSLDIQSQIADTCADESSPDAATTCQGLRKNQENAQAEIVTLTRKVASAKEKYYKL